MQLGLLRVLPRAVDGDRGRGGRDPCGAGNLARGTAAGARRERPCVDGSLRGARSGGAPGAGAGALDRGGRCLIYEARPIPCRSHGAPIRMREGSLPVIRWCHLNFTRTEPDPDCVLDQTTLSALVLAVDREASGDGSRIDLVALLS